MACDQHNSSRPRVRKVGEWTNATRPARMQVIPSMVSQLEACNALTQAESVSALGVRRKTPRLRASAWTQASPPTQVRLSHKARAWAARSQEIERSWRRPHSARKRLVPIRTIGSTRKATVVGRKKDVWSKVVSAA